MGFWPLLRRPAAIPRCVESRRGAAGIACTMTRLGRIGGGLDFLGGLATPSTHFMRFVFTVIAGPWRPVGIGDGWTQHGVRTGDACHPGWGVRTSRDGPVADDSPIILIGPEADIFEKSGLLGFQCPFLVESGLYRLIRSMWDAYKLCYSSETRS